MFTLALHAAPPHHAAMHMTWERGRPARTTAPRARRRPPPGPYPTGGGHPAPPPSGGRLGGGLHAANDGHLSRLCGSAAHEQDEHRFFLGGRSPPRPSRGRRYGETRFPHPPAQGLRPPTPSRGWGHGETRFPHAPAPAADVHVRRSCAWRTTPRCTWPGSAGVPPASRLRGHGDRPFPDPPPLGAGTRRLPPAGGGWEGG